MGRDLALGQGAVDVRQHVAASAVDAGVGRRRQLAAADRGGGGVDQQPQGLQQQAQPGQRSHPVHGREQLADAGGQVQGEGQAPGAAFQQDAEPPALGPGEHVGHRVVAELGAPRHLFGPVLARSPPGVGQVGSQQDQVAAGVGGHVLAHEAGTVAGEDAGQLVFGMVVPGEGETGFAPGDQPEAGFGIGGDQFPGRLHWSK